jgi:hypothetical protein
MAGLCCSILSAPNTDKGTGRRTLGLIWISQTTFSAIFLQ